MNIITIYLPKTIKISTDNAERLRYIQYELQARFNTFVNFADTNNDDISIILDIIISKYPVSEIEYRVLDLLYSTFYYGKPYRELPESLKQSHIPKLIEKNLKFTLAQPIHIERESNDSYRIWL